jgi:eukaryotic-like serine/threonine-protein kinase
MGEVYRAHDPRLGRDVAIKVLRASFSDDPERLERFEQEARAVGMLNHPGILAVHDVGTHDDIPYVVSELLEGRTLRDVLDSGPLAPRQAIDYAIQTAQAIDAAHRRGIVHRDLKPENLFITDDARVKVLDFGLAKLKEPVHRPGSTADDVTRAEFTQPGMLLGSVGYMAPEQVRGQPADERADIFALGAILYEMIVGKRAFQGGSAAETLSAILTEDPPNPGSRIRRISPVLDRIVCRCLEKRPENRFHSAHDLALSLEALSATSPWDSITTVAHRRWARLSDRRVQAIAMAAAAGTLALLAYGWLAPSREPGAAGLAESTPQFQRLTFRRGWISAARFAPDAHTILYSASWDGAPPEIFLVRPESPESRPLGIPDADLLAISAPGELAILRAPRISLNIYHRLGVVARVALGGGAPRDVLESARFADWAPDGTALAVVHDTEDRRRLEYPIGRPLYELPRSSHNTIVSPRVSPDGNHVAFFEGFGARVRRWSVSVVDRTGTKRSLSPDWYDWWRLAWSPRGDEVWFAASQAGSASALYAVSMTGRQRVLFRVPGTVELHDVAADGRVLLTMMSYRTHTRGFAAGETNERDLSWLDGSAAVALSRDGRVLLLDEHGEAGGATNAAYLRRMDGSPAVRLGAGRPLALSPDGLWVLATQPAASPRLYLLPTGAGDTRDLEAQRFEVIRAANWFPDGRQILLAAAEHGGALRLYVHDLESGAAHPLTPEGYDINGDAIAPDGSRVVAMSPDEEVVIWDMNGGTPRAVPGLTPGDLPIGWTADGQSVYVYRRGEIPARVSRVHVTSGARQAWRQFEPADIAGVGTVSAVLVTPDGTAAVYSYEQTLSELYLIDRLE